MSSRLASIGHHQLRETAVMTAARPRNEAAMVATSDGTSTSPDVSPPSLAWAACAATVGTDAPLSPDPKAANAADPSSSTKTQTTRRLIRPRATRFEVMNNMPASMRLTGDMRLPGRVSRSVESVNGAVFPANNAAPPGAAAGRRRQKVWAKLLTALLLKPSGGC